jgi:hypothetical protein
LFLFADRTVLEKAADMFEAIWQAGKGDQTVSLLD